jgi:hypothetical protein
MSDANVIAFPVAAAPSTKAGDFQTWLSWAECELAILGYDLSATDFDWRSAHAKGLRPELAAAEAVQCAGASN